MDVSIIVNANTTSTRDALEHDTIGELADAVAETHAITGEVFTLKVNGRIAERDESTDFGGTAEDYTLELVELTPTNPGHPRYMGEHESPGTGEPMTGIEVPLGQEGELNGDDELDEDDDADQAQG